MKGPIAITIAIILVFLSSSFTFALSVSTHTHGTIVNFEQYPLPDYSFTFDDAKTASGGILFSHSDQNSINVSPDTPPGPLQTGIESSATAVASSSGLLALYTQAEKSGGMDQAFFSAEASWADSFTNSYASSQNYVLNMAVSPIELFLSFGMGEAARALASYEIEIFLNGTSIWSESNALFTDIAPSHLPPFDPDRDTLSLYAPAANFSVPLGVYGPGESFDLEYRARAESWLFDAVERMSIVTPYTVSGGITSSAPVPEPASLLLIAFGVAGITALKGKSRTGRGQRC